MATEAARTETSDIALTLQFLDFVAVGTRIYGDTTEGLAEHLPASVDLGGRGARRSCAQRERRRHEIVPNCAHRSRQGQLMRDSCNGSGSQGPASFRGGR
jgi:hypothetical protein